MKRSRIVMTVLAIALVAMTLATAQSGDPNAEILAKLTAMEKRLASMERNLNAKLTAMEQAIAKGGGGGGPSAELEAQAQAEAGKVQTLANSGKMTEAKAAFDDFNTKYAGTAAHGQLRRLGAELAVIGKDAPGEWGIDDWYQGESDIDLASGKTTLLVFWEVWCPHCKREVPKLQQIYDDLKGDGLQVVGLTKLSRSATEQGVKDFMNETSVGYPVAKENGSASQWFNVSGVPAAAVVKDGKVIWRGHPARLNEALLKSWL